MRSGTRSGVIIFAMSIAACRFVSSPPNVAPRDGGTEPSDAGSDALELDAPGPDGGGSGDSRTPYIVRVVDTSMGAESCGVIDPGSDIFAVALEDVDGTVIGWGKTLGFEVQFDDNGFENALVLDGEDPALGSDRCPETFGGSTVVSLGCSGWVAVTFLEPGGDVVSVGAEPAAVRVMEYGDQCLSGASTDTYRVELCTDQDAVAASDPSSCTITVGDGTAESAFTLPDQ